uniref:E2 ubiquitin-conjugating enzyme n=2 Tax=Ascaris TaxID=6251 RepID=A0A0M3HW76_ASCLU
MQAAPSGSDESAVYSGQCAGDEANAGHSIGEVAQASQTPHEAATRSSPRRDRSPLERTAAPSGPSDMPSSSRRSQSTREVTPGVTRNQPKKVCSPIERAHALSKSWQTATGWDPRTLGNSGNVTITSTAVARRLIRELEDLERNAIEGCWARPKGDDLFEWVAVIEGPEDTVYRGGTFFLELYIPKDYPFHPPTVTFLTQIYHCNISRGVVCIDVLRQGWTPAMTISVILQSIVSLLYVCNPVEPLVSSIAEQYLTNREKFERVARVWTARYAS